MDALAVLVAGARRCCSWPSPAVPPALALAVLALPPVLKLMPPVCKPQAPASVKVSVARAARVSERSLIT